MNAERIISAAREVFDVATRKGTLYAEDERDNDEIVGFFVPPREMKGLGKALVEAELNREPMLELTNHAELVTNKAGDNIAVKVPIEVWRAAYPFFEEVKKREG